jgi:hypothetical protein
MLALELARYRALVQRFARGGSILGPCLAAGKDGVLAPPLEPELEPFAVPGALRVQRELERGLWLDQEEQPAIAPSNGQRAGAQPVDQALQLIDRALERALFVVFNLQLLRFHHGPGIKCNSSARAFTRARPGHAGGSSAAWGWKRAQLSRPAPREPSCSGSGSAGHRSVAATARRE